jgi:hypothetical protein
VGAALEIQIGGRPFGGVKFGGAKTFPFGEIMERVGRGELTVVVVMREDG